MVNREGSGQQGDFAGNERNGFFGGLSRIEDVERCLGAIYLAVGYQSPAGLSGLPQKKHGVEEDWPVKSVQTRQVSQGPGDLGRST